MAPRTKSPLSAVLDPIRELVSARADEARALRRAGRPACVMVWSSPVVSHVLGLLERGPSPNAGAALGLRRGAPLVAAVPLAALAGTAALLGDRTALPDALLSALSAMEDPAFVVTPTGTLVFEAGAPQPAPQEPRTPSA